MGKAPTELSSRTLERMQGILAKLDERFPIAEAPEFGSLVNYSANANEPIHRWFRYREGYSTDLVETLLRATPDRQLFLDPSYGNGQLVLDPFCGAGTTLLAASRLGYRSIGIDANPLSVFVSQVKTRKYSHSQLDRFEEICSRIREPMPNGHTESKPKLSIIDKVFLPEVLKALLVTKHFIENSLAGEERDFFFLAWLSILEEVSNIYREGNGIKYRNRKRTPSGYVDIPIEVWARSWFPEDRFDYVLSALVRRAQMMVSDAREARHRKYEPEVYEGDALALDDFVEPGSVAFVCFSPPYANNFNYFKAYKVELWMGSFVSSYTDLRELTGRSLRSHVETSLRRDDDGQNWYPEELDELLDLMESEYLWTSRIPQAVRGYFFDMRKVLEKVQDALSINGQCVIVVGNSAYGGVLIPTDALLAETAAAEGFEVEKIAVARHLTTSSQQKKALEPVREHLRESVVFLRKKRLPHQRPSPGNGYMRYRYVSELPRFPSESRYLIYVIRNRGLTDHTHNIHKYPSKFIPHVPRWAIKKLLAQAGGTVLDPFVGSGTTLVEALLAGHNSYGIDIDPLARLISKVKTTPIEPGRLSETVDDVITQVTAKSESQFRPRIDTLDHWFTPEASGDLGDIREVIEGWRERDKDLYDFLIVCMSSIIRRASNADNQSLKTYVSGTHRKSPEPAKPLFVRTLRNYAERIVQFTEAVRPGVRSTILSNHDARDFADGWNQHGLPLVDLAITSPPYIKTVDYVYNQMAEYFWIGDLFGLENQDMQNEYKRRYIGTEKVVTDEYRDFDRLAIPAVADIVDQLRERNTKHAYIVNQYFADMQTHFQQMRRVLRSGAAYVVVVGDSSISDLDISTHDLLPHVANEQGFELEHQFAYEIRNRYMRFPRQGRGGVVKYDWVLLFRYAGN